MATTTNNNTELIKTLAEAFGTNNGDSVPKFLEGLGIAIAGDQFAFPLGQALHNALVGEWATKPLADVFEEGFQTVATALEDGLNEIAAALADAVRLAVKVTTGQYIDTEPVR